MHNQPLTRITTLLLLTAVLLGGLVTATSAQQEVSLLSLEVDFWPEYDRPEMLVIFRAELDPAVNLPVDLTFRIPAHVGPPHAVAAGQSNDSLFTVTADRQVDGDWAYITFNTTMPIVRLEYYDSELSLDDQNRQFEFTWGGDYAVGELLLQVQQPCDTTDMQISPSLGNGVVGSDGLVYFANTFGSLNAGQEFNLTINYTKTSDCLTISTLDVATELPEDTAGRVRLTDVLPYILGLLGVLLIVGGVVWYWQSGRQPVETTARARRGRRTASQSGSTDFSEQQPGRTESAVYCHNCGKRANSTDKFCRSCGSRLRTP
jgi:hypothetical protein